MPARRAAGWRDGGKTGSALFTIVNKAHAAGLRVETSGVRVRGVPGRGVEAMRLRVGRGGFGRARQDTTE
jgi:hypothetical protein